MTRYSSFAASDSSAKRVKQDAERVSHPVVGVPLPGTKKLTGFLAMLPPEILMEVLVRCEPSGVMRLLATSKALTNMANENETTIYRKLYHNLVVKGAIGAHAIHSPVWKQGKAPLSYPLSGALPATAVYSWKVQYKITAVYTRESRRTTGNRTVSFCLRCDVSEREAIIVDVPAFQLNLCLICYAKEIIPPQAPDCLATMRLTQADVKTVAPAILHTATTTTKAFFSAGVLEQLAIQKHGSFEGPVGMDDVARDTSARREAIAAVATLLHGGTAHFNYAPPHDDFDTGHFVDEFDHYVRNAGFRKPKYPTAPHPKGYPNADQLKKRPIEEILADYVKLIREHKDDFPDQEGLPVFLPARRPGPVMPSEESIAAFNKLVVGEDQLDKYRQLINQTRSPLMIKTLQRYMLSPTDVNYQHAMDLDDFRRFIPRPITRTPRPARKTFAPLLIDQPFESSPTHRTVFARRLSALSLPTLVSFPPKRAVRAFLSEDYDSDIWTAGFFQMRLGMLPEIYMATAAEQISEYKAICARVECAEEDVHRIVPSCSRPHRSEKLADRTKHPFAPLQEELLAVARDVRSGVITHAGFFAAHHQALNLTPCPNLTGTVPFCLDGCWIDEVGQEELDGDVSGSSDYE